MVFTSDIQASYWTCHGLDQLASLRQVCVSDRKPSTTVPQLTTYNTLHDYVQVSCGIPALSLPNFVGLVALSASVPGAAAALRGASVRRPAEPASTAVPQLTTYNTLHDYVQLSSAAPSAPLVPSSSIPASYWTYHGLDQLASLRQVCVSDRKPALEMEFRVPVLQLEKGPGMNFYLLTSADQKVLLGNRIKSEVCCSDPVETVTVSRPPDVKIGTVEGHGKNFALKNASGDTLCSLEMEDRGCCDCSEKIYQVVPSSAPHSQGSVEICCDGCKITFPSAMDVISKALLICFAINLLYSIEEDRKRN
ncbi:hypothetical protein C7M84_008468 [Penaeus vannamei]|uniref:Phospholipid scramblase n=1 Tax=Penaeus vannamei TaxID=6689 RepID=A0A3R7MCX2_PENVA|nr:hypothetical protein C7M84_008468 [Penaeus vannamei]